MSKKNDIKNLKNNIKNNIGISQMSTHFTITFKSYDEKAEYLESIGINGDETIITASKYLDRLGN
jgi:hypothetical protein